MMTVLCAMQLLPCWKLLLLGTASFFAGSYLMVVVWAGVPAAQLPLARALPSFVASFELLCSGVFLYDMLPLAMLGNAGAAAVLAVCCLATLTLHWKVHRSDPGFVPLPSSGKSSDTAMLCVSLLVIIQVSCNQLVAPKCAASVTQDWDVVTMMLYCVISVLCSMVLQGLSPLFQHCSSSNLLCAVCRYRKQPSCCSWIIWDRCPSHQAHRYW